VFALAVRFASPGTFDLIFEDGCRTGCDGPSLGQMMLYREVEGLPKGS